MNAAAGNLVVVTGIGGFLGRHVAAQLLEQGYRVRGTVRSLKRAKAIEAAIYRVTTAANGRLEFVGADLLSDAGWAQAMAGATFVIHTASPFPSSAPRDADALVPAARDGTLRVLEAARQAGVQRVVLTSSIAAINYGSGKPPFTESHWTDIESPLTTPYYRSKTLAEQAAWDFARANNMELSVINPGMILGPILGDEVGTSVGLIRSLLKGKYPVMPDFRVSVVDVRDVADAHIRAMQLKGAAGERFIVSGQVFAMKEIVNVLRQRFPAYASKLPRFVLPNWLARLAAPFDAGLKLIVAELGRDARVSNEKARTVLGWQPRPEVEAIEASAASLIEAGLV